MFFKVTCPGQKSGGLISKLTGRRDLPDLCYNVVVKELTARMGPQVRDKNWVSLQQHHDNNPYHSSLREPTMTSRCAFVPTLTGVAATLPS